MTGVGSGGSFIGSGRGMPGGSCGGALSSKSRGSPTGGRGKGGALGVEDGGIAGLGGVGVLTNS